MAVDIHKSWLEHCAQRRVKSSSAAAAPTQQPEAECDTRGDASSRAGGDVAEEVELGSTHPSGSEDSATANVIVGSGSQPHTEPVGSSEPNTPKGGPTHPGSEVRVLTGGINLGPLGPTFADDPWGFADECGTVACHGVAEISSIGAGESKASGPVGGVNVEFDTKVSHAGNSSATTQPCFTSTETSRVSHSGSSPRPPPECRCPSRGIRRSAEYSEWDARGRAGGPATTQTCVTPTATFHKHDNDNSRLDPLRGGTDAHVGAEVGRLHANNNNTDKDVGAFSPVASSGGAVSSGLTARGRRRVAKETQHQAHRV